MCVYVCVCVCLCPCEWRDEGACPCPNALLVRGAGSGLPRKLRGGGGANQPGKSARDSCREQHLVQRQRDVFWVQEVRGGIQGGGQFGPRPLSLQPGAPVCPVHALTGATQQWGRCKTSQCPGQLAQRLHLQTGVCYTEGVAGEPEKARGLSSSTSPAKEDVARA